MWTDLSVAALPFSSEGPVRGAPLTERDTWSETQALMALSQISSLVKDKQQTL